MATDKFTRAHDLRGSITIADAIDLRPPFELPNLPLGPQRTKHHGLLPTLPLTEVSAMPTRKPKPVAFRTPTSAVDPSANVPDPPGLEINDAVFSALEDVSKQLQEVRTELMQLHGMIRCLADVLKYADDDDSMMHSDVATVVGRLLNDQITEIELIRNRIPTTPDQATKIMDASDKEVEG